MSVAPESIMPSPSIWERADVSDPARWTEVLTADEHAHLERMVAAVGDRPLATLGPEHLSDGPLTAACARRRRELRDGRGFLLVRGLDVARFAPAALERAYMLLGLHFGKPKPQNLRGELLTHVRDTGADPTLLSTRLYTTRAEQDFHTDGADVIGLLCRRTARSGGASRIGSSGAIVREIARTRPDLYPVLFEPFPWHYQEEGFPPLWFARPICTTPASSVAGARLNTFFIPWYIRRSQELPAAPRLTPAQLEVVALLEELANQPRFHIDMVFEPGDLQWLRNAAILHKRTAYEDHDEPDRKRHLLRLWLSAPDFEDGDPQLREGVRQD